MLKHSSDPGSGTWFPRLWAETTAPLHGKVLDVGCGKGDEALILASLPNVTEVVAYDPGYRLDDLVGRLQTRYDAETMAKIVVFTEPDEIPTDCDSAFSWNATEHFLRPIEDMEFVCSRLKPGGAWSGRHYNYYCPKNGHHLAIEYYQPYFERFCAIHGEDHPHLSMAKRFTTDFRCALRLQHLNMMTLYQFHMYAIVAGFEVKSWRLSQWGPEPPAQNPYLSPQDMTTMAVHFEFQKVAEPVQRTDRLPDYLTEVPND